ncbi:MAG TPA: ABC transporter permease [Devosia sp.]|uniref:ABC transporter permease n=1 Tax=Devosia sp. TaxID=1871048 RepID=UPI002DDCCA59|nr:ABC transporter permease [Devosia sp.]HEV2514341.1 ABC transporter permease [Devosia sp.]
MSTDTPATVRPNMPGKRFSLLLRARRQGLLVVLIIVVAYFSFASPYFLSQSNLLNIGALSAALGIMALSQTFLVISRGIDISVGSVVALSGVLFGVLLGQGVDIWIAAIGGLAVGAAVGAANGLLVVRLKVDPLVATLGTLSIFGGLAYMISGSQTLFIDDPAFSFLGTGRVFGVPFQLLLFLVLFGVFLFVERRATIGRNIYATGGNLEAARLAGLRVDLTRFLLYVVSGLSAAVSGLILTSQLSATSAQVGAPYLLSVVTAVILGGASLAGGRGTVVGTLIAVSILGVLQNGFALLGLSSFAQQVALGTLLIIAVLLDQVGKRR